MDYSVFDGLRRSADSRQVDRSTLDKWLAKFPGKSGRNAQIRHALEHYLFRSMAEAGPGVLLAPYTQIGEVRVRPEVEYYQAEWQQRQAGCYVDRASGKRYIWISPLESFTDFALASFDKMIKRGGMQILYVDNPMYCGHAYVNLPAGVGYVRDDGCRQGGYTLFALRRFIRRAAHLFHQNGRYPLVYVHMTNFAVVPAFSFAAMQLDWEWKYESKEDFQDRFPDDLIRAESTGRQAGLVPGVLCRLDPAFVSGAKESARLRRSLHSVLLAHDIRHWCVPIPELEKQRYWEGYDCLPCWRNRHLVSATGGNVKLVLYRRGERLLVGVSNDGDNALLTVRLHLRALGLREIVSIADAGSDAPLPLIGRDCVRVHVPRHDYRVLLVEAKTQ